MCTLQVGCSEVEKARDFILVLVRPDSKKCVWDLKIHTEEIHTVVSLHTKQHEEITIIIHYGLWRMISWIVN